MIALFLLGAVDSAEACGTVAQSFFSHSLETDRPRLESFLDSASCGDEEKYSPERADPVIALVLANSARAGVPATKIERVLTRFNCAATARDQPAYAKIIDYLGTTRYREVCGFSALARMLIVSSSGGANLRTAPSTSAPKLGAIAEGALVKNAERDGEWLLVDTFLGRGYMHESTLKSYVTTAASAFEQLAAELWRGSDAQRIQFVNWVNEAQPCRSLSKPKIYELLGHPESMSEWWGGSSQQSMDALSTSEAPDGSGRLPDQTDWIYQTLRPGSKESAAWSGEGSTYLLDLGIHFGPNALAVGCGTTQYTSGAEYNEMLEMIRTMVVGES